MEFNLNQILESTILLEGRKEDVIRKYGEENIDLINKLSQEDPSGNNKYLGWMTKAALGKLEVVEDILNADSIVRLVNGFHKNLPRIKNKDINSYESIFEFKAVVDEAEKKAEEKKFAKQAKKVYEDDEVVVFAPFTVQASCKYGAGSQWCIAATSGNNGFNNHFEDYSRHSNFYFFIKKNAPATGRDYKYALQYKFTDGGGQTWWDAQDSPSQSRPTWVTQEMMDKVEAFNPIHKEKKLSAQLQTFLQNPTIKDYKKFSDILKPEQRNFVVDKLLNSKNVKLDSTTFKILSGDLSPKQKNEFITKYTQGEVSINDYKEMRDNLTVDERLLVVVNNPHILNQFEVMKDISDEIDQSKKNEIATKIDAKKINNTDSKVLLRKWSYTPEDLEKHNQSNFYVFLSRPNKEVVNLLKVDPLDPASYRIINMLKLKLENNDGMEFYGIKTDLDILENSVDSNSEQMDDEVLDFIKNNRSKIG